MMDRPMRRKDRLLEHADAMALLQRGEYGVLSCAAEDGTPYGVPLSYVVHEEHIYFHCAHEGRKVDYLAQRPQVSFCVVGATQSVYDPKAGTFGAYFESVVVRGEASLVTDDGEKRRSLDVLCRKYLPEYAEHIEASINAAITMTAVYKISIDALTGKQRKPLVP